MCFKKLKGKISQSIVACKLRSIGRLTKQKLQSVVPIFVTIIAIFLLIKFLPNKIEFLGIEILDIKGEDKGNLMSFIELIIEGIFCILVWKEFKMTRKSFEWQQTEQQEKKDKEANRQLLEIIKFFTRPWIEFLLSNKMNFENIKKNFKSFFSPDEYNKKIKELISPEKDKRIEYMFSKINFDTTKEEKNMIIHILEKFVINHDHAGIIKKHTEEKTDREILNEYIDSIKIKPETAKHMNIDYKELEKIYNNILYGYVK